MQVVVSHNGVGKGDNFLTHKLLILRNIVFVQHLRDDFESALNVIPHPLASYLSGRIVPAKIVEIWQAPEIACFDERRATMVEISSRAVLSERQSVHVHFKPGFEQIEIARRNKRPVK